MILLSRALYNMPEADTKAIKETLSTLSDKLVGEAELILAEVEGASVNKKKLEIIAQEEKLIAEVRACVRSYRLAKSHPSLPCGSLSCCEKMAESYFSAVLSAGLHERLLSL